MKFLVVFLMGCGPTSYYLQSPKGATHQCSLPVMVGISHNVPPKERPAILAAQSWWNATLKSQVFFDMGVVPFAPDDLEAGGLFVVGYPNNYKATQEVVARAFVRQNYQGCITGGFVSLIQKLSEQDPKQVEFALKHELGHLLGLADLPWRGSIMSGKSEPSNFPTSFSEVELEALQLFYGSK